MYKLITVFSNGYTCSCCRHTWDNEDNFDTLEEVKSKMNQIRISRQCVNDGCELEDFEIINYQELSPDEKAQLGL